MAVITIFFALTGWFPGLEVLPYVAGDFLLVPELDDPSSVSTGELFHKYLSSWWSSALPCVPSRPSSISYPAPDISVTSSLSGSGSISAKMKDDWTRPLLIGNPQGGQSSSRCGRSRYSNVGCGGCLVTLLQLLLDSSGAVPNSYYPVLRWDRS